MADTVTTLPQRGKTWHGGAVAAADYGNSVDKEGSVMQFAEVGTVTGMGAKPKTSSRKTTCILVRNVGATALLPGYAVTFAAGYRGKRVDGYARTTAVSVAGIVDDQLPSGGVAVGDLFWLMVKGPALLKTSLAGNAENVIAEGGVLVALTAATSGATTAGRVNAQLLTGATQPLADQIQNRIGVAMSAKTTANTNANVLVDLRIDDPAG